MNNLNPEKLANYLDIALIGVTILIFVILVLCFLRGLLRGWKKGTYHFIFMAILFIVAIFTLDVSTQAAMNFNISFITQEIKFNLQGTDFVIPVTTAGETAKTAIYTILKDGFKIDADPSALYNYSVAMAVSFVKLVLVFLEALIILIFGNLLALLLWHILFKWFLPYRIRKRHNLRWVSGIQSVLVAIVTMSLLIAPLSSVVNTISNNIDFDSTSLNTNQNKTVKLATDLLDTYQNSLFSKVFFSWAKPDGKNSLDYMLMDYLIQSKVGETSVSGLREIASLSSIAGDVGELYFGNSFEDGIAWRAMLTSTEQVTSIMKELGKTSLFQVVVPFAVKVAAQFKDVVQYIGEDAATYVRDTDVDWQQELQIVSDLYVSAVESGGFDFISDEHSDMPVLLFDDPYSIIFTDRFHDSLDEISKDLDKMALFNRIAAGALYTMVSKEDGMKKDDDPATLQLIDLLPLKEDGTVDLEKFVTYKWGEEIMTLVDPLYTIHDNNPAAIKSIFNSVLNRVAPKEGEPSETQTDEEWRDELIQDVLNLVADSSDSIIEAFVGKRDAQRNPIVDDKGKNDGDDSCIFDSAFLINAFPSIPDFLGATAKGINPDFGDIDVDMTKSKEALLSDTSEKGLRVAFKKEFASILDVVGEVTKFPEGKELIRNYKDHPGVDLDPDGQFLGIIPNLAKGFQAGLRRLDDSKMLKDIVPPVGKAFIENNEAIKNFGLEHVYLDNVDFGDELAKLLDVVIRCPDVVTFGGTMSGNTSMDRIMTVFQDDDFADQLVTSLDIIGACKLINPPEEHNKPIFNIINKFMANVDFISFTEEDFNIPNLFGTYDSEGHRTSLGETYYLIQAVQTVAESGIVKTLAGGTPSGVSETVRALTKVNLEELLGSIGGSSLLRKAVVASLDDMVIDQMLKPSEVKVENLSFGNLNHGTLEQIQAAWRNEGTALNAIVALADRGVDFSNIDIFGGQGDTLIQILKKFADSGIFKYVDNTDAEHYLFNQYFCNKLIVSLKGSELKYFCDQNQRAAVAALDASATLEQKSPYLTTFINNCAVLDQPSDWANDGAQLDHFSSLIKKIGELGGLDALSNISTDNIDQLKEVLNIVVDSDVVGNVVVPNAIEDAIDNIEAQDFEFDNANTPYLWSLNSIADKAEAKAQRLTEVTHIMGTMSVLFDSHYGIYQGGSLDMSKMNVYSISTEYFMRPVLSHSRASHVLYEPKDPTKLSVFQLTMATFVKHSGIYGNKVTSIEEWISTPTYESNKYCDYSIRELVEKIPAIEWDQEIETLCDLIDRAKETIFVDPVQKMIDFSAISDPKTFFNSDVTGKNEQDLRDLVTMLNQSELFYRSLPYHLATSFENIDVLGGDFVADIAYSNPYFDVAIDSNGRRDQNRYAQSDIDNLLDVLKIFGSKASGINMTDITNIDAGGVGDLLEAMGGCAVFNKYNEISSPTKVITNPAQAHKQGLTSFQAVMVDFLTTDALKQYYYSDNSPKDSALPYDSLKTKAVYEVQHLLPSMGEGFGPAQTALINGENNSLRRVLFSLTSPQLSSIVSNTGFEVGKLNYETFMLLLGELNNCALTQDIVPNAISSMVTGSGAYAPNIDGVKFDRGNYYFSYWWYGNPITYHSEPDFTQKFYVPELEQMASICSFLSDNMSAVESLTTFDIAKIDPYLMRDMLAELSASYCFHLAGPEELDGKTYEVNNALVVDLVSGVSMNLAPLTVFEQLMFKFYVDSGLAKEAFDVSYDIHELLIFGEDDAHKVKVYDNINLFNDGQGSFSHTGDWLTEIEALTTDGRRHNGYDLDDSDVGLLETIKTLNSIMGGSTVQLDVEKFKKLSPAQIRWVLQGLNRVDIVSDALAKSARALITTNSEGDGLGIHKYTTDTETYVLSPAQHSWTLPNDGYFLDNNMRVASRNIRFRFTGNAALHFTITADFSGEIEDITAVTDAGSDLTPDGDGYYTVDLRSVPGVFTITANDPVGVFTEVIYSYDTANFRQSQASFASTDINSIYYFLASAYRGRNLENENNLYFSFDEGKGITEFLDEGRTTGMNRTFYQHSTYGLMNFFLTSNIYAQSYDSLGKLTTDDSQIIYTAGDYALYNLFQLSVEFNGSQHPVNIADNFGDGDEIDHLKYLNEQRKTYYEGNLTVEHSLLESAYLDDFIIGAGTLQAYIDASKIAFDPIATPMPDVGFIATNLALGLQAQNDLVQNYLDKAMTQTYHNAVNGHFDPSIPGTPAKFLISLDDDEVRTHLTGNTDPITEPGYIGKSILAGQTKAIQDLNIHSVNMTNAERATVAGISLKSPTQPDTERADVIADYGQIDPYGYDAVNHRYTFATLKDNVETASMETRLLRKVFAGMGTSLSASPLTDAQKEDLASYIETSLVGLSGDRKSVIDTFYLGSLYNALLVRGVFYSRNQNVPTATPPYVVNVQFRNDVFDMRNAANYVATPGFDYANPVEHPYNDNVAFSYDAVAQAIRNSLTIAMP